MSNGLKPITSAERSAAQLVFDLADDDVTKAELRRRVGEAVRVIREGSGPWDVYAESWDMPGPGYVVSSHSNEADALTECIRLNRANDSDAGGYTHRRALDDGKNHG